MPLFLEYGGSPVIYDHVVRQATSHRRLERDRDITVTTEGLIKRETRALRTAFVTPIRPHHLTQLANPSQRSIQVK